MIAMTPEEIWLQAICLEEGNIAMNNVCYMGWIYVLYMLYDFATLFHSSISRMSAWTKWAEKRVNEGRIRHVMHKMKINHDGDHHSIHRLLSLPLLHEQNQCKSELMREKPMKWRKQEQEENNEDKLIHETHEHWFRFWFIHDFSLVISCFFPFPFLCLIIFSLGMNDSSLSQTLFS